jgi:hypothetical protein
MESFDDLLHIYKAIMDTSSLHKGNLIIRY